MASSSIVQQGYLEKESLYLKKFRKRWIELNVLNDSLYCYKLEVKKSAPTEVIKLTEFNSIKTNTVDMFILIHGGSGKNRTFRTKDKSALYEWMNKISDMIRNERVRQLRKEHAARRDNSGLYQFQHEVTKQKINCPEMVKHSTKDPLKCSIYGDMKLGYEYNQQNLDHLQQYRHHENSYENKPECKYGDECQVYIRSETGRDMNSINDKCHMTIYRHPPRTRSRLKLEQNIHSLIINKQTADNHPLHNPTHTRNPYNEEFVRDGWLQELLSEVRENGFGYDLCLSCSKGDNDCIHGYDRSIMKIVDEKMKSIRHKVMTSPLNRGQMLALVLYTGCDCNYDLCASQRSGNYSKWKFFDLCLYEAIKELSIHEKGQYPVYSGLNGVKMDTKFVRRGFFVTYVSTSWRKEVSEMFMGKDKGMIIHFDEDYRNNDQVFCCDVSWISKFPDECEVLFARSLNWNGWDSWRVESHYVPSNNNFSCEILDDSNGIQTIRLR